MNFKFPGKFMKNIRWKNFLLLVFTMIVVLLLDMDISRSQSGQKCDTNPPIIGESSILQIGLTKDPVIRQLTISPKRPIGYRFKAKSGDTLTFGRPPGICHWLALDNQSKPIDYQEPLPKEGEYTLKFSSLENEFGGSITLGLTPANEANPAKSKSDSVNPVSNNGLEIDWRKDLMLATVVNISTALLLTLCNQFGITKSFKQSLREAKENKEIGSLKLFWGNKLGTGLSKAEKYHIVYKESALTTDYHQAMSRVKEFLEGHITNERVDLHPLRQDDYLKGDLFKDNVVILADGVHQISGFEDFCETAKIPYSFDQGQQQQRLKLLRRRNNDVMEAGSAFISKQGENTATFAFGLLTRIINPENKKVIIILNGGHKSAIDGSARFLTANKGDLPRNSLYLDFERLNKEVNSYQLVLEVTNNREHQPQKPSGNLHLGAWHPFDVTATDINSAIDKFHKRNYQSP